MRLPVTSRASVTSNKDARGRLRFAPQNRNPKRGNWLRRTWGPRQLRGTNMAGYSIIALAPAVQRGFISFDDREVFFHATRVAVTPDPKKAR